MDLSLFLRVVWRFRVLVLVGTIFAVVLAFLAVVRIDLSTFPPGAAYRESEVWETSSMVFVTERGAPWSRSSLQIEPSGRADAQFADPGRFSSLATLYARLAESDAVMQIVLRDGPLPGGIQVQQVTSGSGSRSEGLPLLYISGLSDTPAKAITTARRATRAFMEYLDREQKANGVAAADRVILDIVVEPGTRMNLLTARSKTLPAVILFTVLMLVFGLAFILENLRPRVRPVTAQDERQRDIGQTRLSA